MNLIHCTRERWNYYSMELIYDSIEKKELIEKGWSEDKKYCVTTSDGTRYLLRVSPIEKYETKKSLFLIMEQIATLDIPMCLPIEFGICNEGVYSIQSWINGVDLETVLPLSAETVLSEKEQYELGLQAGKIAKKIHSLPIAESQQDWYIKFNREIDMVIGDYCKCGLKIDGDEFILECIEKNRHLLKSRPQCLLVSDYNIMNMMYEENQFQNGRLKIIDFERFGIGDPWNEFNCIVWSAMASPHFATGQIHGYFEGEPSKDFFDLLTLYISVLVLSLMSSWAVVSEFGRNATLNMSKDVLKWFDSMQNPVPTWFKRKVDNLKEIL